MANASGLYGLTLEKMMIDTLAKSIESETLIYTMLTTNTYTPNFDTNAFRSSIDATEPSTSGTYTPAGGTVITTTEITVGSPAATQMKYATASPSWTTATLTARGMIGYVHNGGASSADELIWDSDFGGDVSSVAGTFSVTCPANGWYYLDYA